MKRLIVISFILQCIFCDNSFSQFNSSKYDSFTEYKFGDSVCYIVKNNNKYGVVNSKGNILVPIDIDKINEVYESDILKEVIFEFKKNGQVGMINLFNKTIIPLDNWNQLYKVEGGPFFVSVKKGTRETDYNSYNSRLDTTYLFSISGNLLHKTEKFYNFEYFYIDTCITQNNYFKVKPSLEHYYNGFYDLISFKKGQNEPVLLFEHCKVELWPDKKFFVFQQGSKRSKASFYSLNGDLISKNGDYTKICCREMYPRYEAVEYDSLSRSSEGLTYLIDESGKKLSFGYDKSIILGKANFAEDGYFYKFIDNVSILPICKPKQDLVLSKKTVPVKGDKNIISKTSEEVKIPKLLNQFEDILMRVERYSQYPQNGPELDNSLRALIDFNGKPVSSWYTSMKILPGKFYDKTDVYSGGNERVCNFNADSTKSLCGIYNRVIKKEILPLRYDNIYLFKDGIYTLELDNKFGLWFQKDNKLIDPIYDNIDEYPSRVKLNGVWGKIENNVFSPF